MEYEIQYFVNGEEITSEILNRPLQDIGNNLDFLFTLVNSDDPFPQYTLTAEATQIAEDNAILFSIALA